MSDHKTTSIGIIGVGSYLPQKVMTNFDLEKMVDTSNEWILKRTGISERRILDEGVPASSMGVEASKRALEDAGLGPDDIDLIIATTECPDYLTPSMACLIQRELKAVNAAAFDLNAACSGFVYALTIAEKLISCGYYKNILIVACEALSRIIDWQDRNTCVLLGDGSGAAVLGRVEDGHGIISTHLGADGAMSHTITIPSCYKSESDIEARHNGKMTSLRMDGSEVFKFAVRVLPAAVEKVLEISGIPLDKIKRIIPHQANIRIIEGAAKRLEIEMDRIYTNLHKYGNISSASIPVAIDEVMRSGNLKKGDYIVLVGFGGGLTWASALIRWSK